MDIKYAGFWSRFFSIIIDTVIVTPFALMVVKSIKLGKPTFTIIMISWSLSLWIIYLIMLYKYGGTPGKLFVGIRVRKLSGEKAGFREVFFRSIVDMVFGLTLLTGYLIAVNAMDIQHYLELKLKFRQEYLFSFAPFWRKPIDSLSNIWVWGELVVLLFNKKRRAIHDLIAGTIVIHMPITFPELREAWYQKIGSNENVDDLTEEEFEPASNS